MVYKKSVCDFNTNLYLCNWVSNPKRINAWQLRIETNLVSVLIVIKLWSLLFLQIIKSNGLYIKSWGEGFKVSKSCFLYVALMYMYCSVDNIFSCINDVQHGYMRTNIIKWRLAFLCVDQHGYIYTKFFFTRQMYIFLYWISKPKRNNERKLRM